MSSLFLSGVALWLPNTEQLQKSHKKHSPLRVVDGEMLGEIYG